MYKVINVVSKSDTATILRVEEQDEEYIVKRVTIGLDALPADIGIRGELYVRNYISPIIHIIYTERGELLVANIFSKCYYGTAREFFVSHKFSTLTLTVFLKDVLQSLCDIHRIGISHRNVKLDNILYDIENGRLEFALNDFRLSGRGKCTVIAETPIECAIEEICEQETDHLLDIYSLGICMFEILGVPIHEKIQLYADQLRIVAASPMELYAFINKMKDLEKRELLCSYYRIETPIDLRAAKSASLYFYRFAIQCIALPVHRPSAEELLDDVYSVLGKFDE